MFKKFNFYIVLYTLSMAISDRFTPTNSNNWEIK